MTFRRASLLLLLLAAVAATSALAATGAPTPTTTSAPLLQQAFTPFAATAATAAPRSLASRTRTRRSLVAAPTTLALSSSANPSFVGDDITVVATVTAAGNPVTEGAVTFREGTTVLAANVALNASGQASVVLPALTEGTHTIAAGYDGSVDFGVSAGSITQVVNRRTVVSGPQFCNPGAITLSGSAGTASRPYPSRIFVSGLSGSTTSVVLTLNGLSLPSSADVDVLLQSPTGQKLVPLASAGGTATTSGATVTLDDAAASALPSTGGLASGTYRPGAYAAASFPAPAPAAPYSFAPPWGVATLGGTFSGSSPNGTWELFVVRNSSTTGEPGTLAGGWCLTIGTSSATATVTTASVTPSPSLLDGQVVVSARVAAASTGAPVALGTVTFFEGSTAVAGPLALGADGVTSFTTSTLGQGAHRLEARYSGVPGQLGASRGDVLHYVDAPTTSPSAGRFCNAAPLTFPNAVGAASAPYPVRVTVSGVAGVTSKVTLSLNQLAHQAPDDLDLMLTGPNGASVVVLSDVGGLTGVSGVDLVLDATAAVALPDNAALASGTFRPADYQPGTDTFPFPAPATFLSAPGVTLTTAFIGTSPNGVWTLWAVSDSAGVTGGGMLSGGFCLDVTTRVPALVISKTHFEHFTQGQTGAEYVVTVVNGGPGATSGPVTVVDTPPAGMTVTGMEGDGWTCTVATRTCTTSTPLADGGVYPRITVTVDVADTATSPLTNAVSVSGGDAIGDTATDSTIVLPAPRAPDLTLTKTSTSSFVQGGTATYELAVTNGGDGATTTGYRVTDPLPVGLTVTSVTSPGWDCSAGTATFLDCSATAPIAAGGSAAPITLTVAVAGDAPASVINTATVDGGGDTTPGNNAGSHTASVARVARVTVQTAPAGRAFTVDGTTYTSTQTFSFAVGSQHTVSTTSPQAGAPGTRYVFASWSDGGAISHPVTVSGDMSLTATFGTQHALTTAVSPVGGGTISPASGFYDAGSPLTVTATPAPGFAFGGFTGALTGTTRTQTLSLTGPATVTATFTPSGRVVLASSVVARSGPRNARVWTFRVENRGSGAAVDVRVPFLFLVGGGCVPHVRSALPIPVAAVLAPGASTTFTARIDLTPCPPSSRILVLWTIAANGAAVYQPFLAVGQPQ